MPPKRCTAPKQQEAPLDSSPPRFTFHRAVPASQRFTRRPATASKEIAFSATAGHSDEEEAAKANTNSRSSKQTATRAGQSAVRTTAKKAVSSKTAAAATARRPAPKKSAPSAAAEDEEREANAAEQPSDERKEEEEEEKERVQSKRLTGKKQTAVKPTAPVAVAARSKKAAVVATRQRNKHTAAADGEQMDGHEKGMQTAAQRKVAQPKKDARAQGSKQPPAVQKSKQQQSGGKRAAGNHAAANNEQLSSMQHDEGAEEERTNSRTVLPSEEKKQDALTLLEAFNGSDSETTVMQALRRLSTPAHRLVRYVLSQRHRSARAGCDSWQTKQRAERAARQGTACRSVTQPPSGQTRRERPQRHDRAVLQRRAGG